MESVLHRLHLPQSYSKPTDIKMSKEFSAQ